MAQEKRDVVLSLQKAVDEVKKISETVGVSVSKEKECRFWEALSKRVVDIEGDISTYWSSESSPHLPPCEKQNSVAKGNLDQPLPGKLPIARQSSLQEPAKMLSDATLIQIVTLFFRNVLFNILGDVPKDVDDHVLQHVQKVTMAMHKQAYDKLWNFVKSQLEPSAESVWSILVNEFLPSIQLNEKPTTADKQTAFQELFQQVYCSGKESHPPSDKRPLLRTMEAVMKVQHEALERLNLDRTALYEKLSTELEADCQKQLEENKILKMLVKPNNLLRLARKICQVVSAMLLHSSPIIPFTELGTFCSAYHEPTHSAKEDPEGRSVLVYRTPYLFCYHYGELKTVLKASVTFVIPSGKFLTPLPIFAEQDLRDQVKDLFKRDPRHVDCNKTNKRTDCFVAWYHIANEALTKTMQKEKKLNLQEYQLLTDRNVRPDSHCPPDFFKAFSKRHLLLVEKSSLVTSIDLNKKLTDKLDTSGVLIQKEKGEAVRLVIAFLSSPYPLIPFGVKDLPTFTACFHDDVTAIYKGWQPQTKEIQCYLRPLVVKFTKPKKTADPLFWVKVIRN